MRSSNPHEAIGGAENLSALKRHYICMIRVESPHINEFPKFICVFDNFFLTKPFFYKVETNKKYKCRNIEMAVKTPKLMMQLKFSQIVHFDDV